MAIGGIRTGIGFSDFTPTASKRMQGGAGAAELASVGENFNALRSGAVNFGSQAQAGIAAESLKRRAIMDSNSEGAENALDAISTVKSKKILDEYAKAAARKAAGASKFGSFLQAGGSLIASAIMSDETVKNNIEQIGDALATLRELRPVTFYYNEEYSSSPERLHHGFVAQEYAKHMPDATYYDESIDKLCIDTTELIALLVRSVQQLETKVARMEAQTALAGVKS